MPIKIFLVIFSVIIFKLCVNGCLITNCPVGGKRAGNVPLTEPETVKPCKSCGPAATGQCFGPNICCGPFGCLFGTRDTWKCRQEESFNDGAEPCLLSGAPCNKNKGKCAADTICCSQDACFIDPVCGIDDKQRPLPDIITRYNLYKLMNKYREEVTNDK